MNIILNWVRKIPQNHIILVWILLFQPCFERDSCLNPNSPLFVQNLSIFPEITWELPTSSPIGCISILYLSGQLPFLTVSSSNHRYLSTLPLLCPHSEYEVDPTYPVYSYSPLPFVLRVPHQTPFSLSTCCLDELPTHSNDHWLLFPVLKVLFASLHFPSLARPIQSWAVHKSIFWHHQAISIVFHVVPSTKHLSSLVPSHRIPFIYYDCCLIPYSSAGVYPPIAAFSFVILQPKSSAFEFVQPIAQSQHLLPLSTHVIFSFNPQVSLRSSLFDVLPSIKFRK